METQSGALKLTVLLVSSLTIMSIVAKTLEVSAIMLHKGDERTKKPRGAPQGRLAGDSFYLFALI